MTASPSLAQALAFSPEVDGSLSVPVSGAFSNGPSGLPPEKGFPFGGLLAALCAEAMREGLAIDVPLRSLTVQYLAAAKYDVPINFRPRMLRAGRNVRYASLEAAQGERMTHFATATFGSDSEGELLEPLRSAPPPLDSLPDSQPMRHSMAPHFAQHVDFRFDGGPNILGGNIGKAPVERTWMRMSDQRPMDAPTLCYLLDALYPPSWTMFRSPPMMTTVDFRIDLLNTPTPENCPDGWAFFEFRMLDIGGGWTIDEATAWAADGTPLGVSRQRRKLLPANRD